MINGVRVSLGFNIDKGDVRNYKSNTVDFDGQFTVEVTPKYILYATKQNAQAITEPKGYCSNMYNSLLQYYN